VSLIFVALLPYENILTKFSKITVEGSPISEPANVGNSFIGQ